MANNVSSWAQAIAEGFEPRNYRYQGADLPAGEYEAVLDKKIWAKKVMAINCYFTLKASGEKILLTVYCASARGVYKLMGSPVDFSVCPTGDTFLIRTALNKKNKLVFERATPVASTTSPITSPA